MKLLRGHLEKKAKNLKEKIIKYENKEYDIKINLNLERAVDRRFYIKEFEKETLLFFKDIVKPNMTIFDIGANIGIFSLIAASKMNGTGVVFAFEPADIPFEELKENVRDNQLNNVSIIKKGVYKKTDTLKFNICLDDAYNSIGETPMSKILKTVEIPVVSLTDYCTAEGVTRIDIIKIDAEGAECSILDGAEPLLMSESGPLLICEYNKLANAGLGQNVETLRDKLLGLGYELFYFWNGLLRPLIAERDVSDVVCLKKIHLENEIVKKYLLNF